MSQEYLMSGCQRKFSMENCKKESAHKVAKRNATKRKERKARAKGPSSDSAQSESLALFATDSLELKLAYTAINEHTKHT